MERFGEVGGEQLKDLWNVAFEVLEPVCLGMNHQNGECKLARVLLESQIPIDRDEDIETF